MKITQHASKRMQQRGIKDGMVQLILMFGEVVASDNEGETMQISEKGKRRLYQLLDKCPNKVIITDKSHKTLITAYTATRRRRKKR